MVEPYSEHSLAPRPRTIGILATGTSSPDHREQFGSYADMFIELLSRQSPAPAFRVFNVTDGELPPVPEPQPPADDPAQTVPKPLPVKPSRAEAISHIDDSSMCDGFLITGSKHGVYDPLPWIEPLEAFIRATYRAAVPLVGICFGHQIVASAFGARVEKNPGGWGLGVQKYDLTTRPEFVDPDERSTVSLNAVHQDQVLSKPTGATLFARADYCPFAGFVYGNRILTIQGHPEFSPAYERALIQNNRGGRLPEAPADAALASLSRPVENERVAGWIYRFLAVGDPACT